MSVPTGAQSPPRPATHANSFDRLPAELLLIIYEYVGSSNLMNLALAIYPTFQRHNLAPELTPSALAHMLRLSSRPASLSTHPGAVARMPAELWLFVAQHLEPADILSLMFTFPAVFDQNLTRQTRERLRIWSRRSRKKGASLAGADV